MIDFFFFFFPPLKPGLRSYSIELISNPTGKTMVARILGKLLHMVGILPTDRVTEVQRTDLVGEFVGHTGPKTRRKVPRYPFTCLPCNGKDIHVFVYAFFSMTNIQPLIYRSKKQREEFFLWMKHID